MRYNAPACAQCTKKLDKSWKIWYTILGHEPRGVSQTIKKGVMIMKMTPTTLDRKNNKLRFFTFALAVWLLIAAMPISAFAELFELETQPMGDQTVYVQSKWGE